MSLIVLASRPVSAQTQQAFRPERPYRGIFASGADDSSQTLVGTGSISSGYDDDLLANATGRNRPVSGQQGFLTQLSGGLNYNLNAARGSFNAGLGSTIRYYPSLEHDYYNTHSAGVSGVARLLDKPQVSVHAGAHYQPLTFLAAYPVLAGPESVEAPQPDYVPVDAQYLSYDAGIGVSHRASRKVTLSASATHRNTSKLEHQFWSQSANANVQIQMTREASLRLGYTVSEGHYEGRPTVRVHRPDIGVDFARALSLTRRTSFTFGVGTEATKSGDHTRIRASGSAEVTHEIGRSWLARGAYHRGTYFIETLPEPVFSDSFTASLSGLLTRRIQFVSIASASMGKSGLNTKPFDTYRGSAGLSMALTRYMNVGTNYAYYKYVFDPSIELPTGVPRAVNRQSIRGYVSMWVPILNRARRSDATR